MIERKTVPLLKEALELDVSILSLALQRNHAQHRRTLYYQRIRMALSCLDRHHLVQLSDVTTSYQRLERRLELEITTRTTTTTSRRKSKNDEWDIMSLSSQNQTKQTPSHNNKYNQNKFNNKCNQKFNELWLNAEYDYEFNYECFHGVVVVHAQWMHAAVTQRLPQVLDRIVYASETTFHELVGKGYFLPFGMVVLAALARIRSILLKWGRDAVQACGTMMAVVNKLEHNQQQQYVKLQLLKENLQPFHVSLDFLSNFMEVDPSLQNKKSKNQLIATTSTSSNTTTSVKNSIAAAASIKKGLKNDDDDVGTSVNDDDNDDEQQQQQHNGIDQSQSDRRRSTTTTRNNKNINESNNIYANAKQKKRKSGAIELESFPQQSCRENNKSNETPKKQTTTTTPNVVVPIKNAKARTKKTKRKKKDVIDEIFGV